MANTVTVRTLVDGPRQAELHVYIAGDGSGDLSAQVIVDGSTLSPAPSKLTIERLEGNFNGFTGLVLFDATTDVPAVVIPDAAGGGQFYFPFQKHYGGLPPPSSATGLAGNLLLTTTGLGSGDKGHMVIKVRKD